MVLVVVVAVLALAVTLAAGGDTLARLHVRAVRLLVGAGALQVAAALLVPHSVPVRAVALLLSGLLVALFLAGNRHVAGVPLVAAGLLLNALVVGMNLAMPVSTTAAARAGIGPHDLRLGDDPLHEAAGPGTRLRRLGDTVPLALPWRPQVVSPGDVLVAAGVGLLLVAGAPRKRAAAQKRAVRSTVLESDSTTRGSYS